MAIIVWRIYVRNYLIFLSLISVKSKETEYGQTRSFTEEQLLVSLSVRNLTRRAMFGCRPTSAVMMKSNTEPKYTPRMSDLRTQLIIQQVYPLYRYEYIYICFVSNSVLSGYIIYLFSFSIFIHRKYHKLCRDNKSLFLNYRNTVSGKPTWTFFQGSGTSGGLGPRVKAIITFLQQTKGICLAHVCFLSYMDASHSIGGNLYANEC